MPRPRPSKQGTTLMVLVLCKPRGMLLCERTLDPAVPRRGVAGQLAGVSDSRVHMPQQGQPCSLP